MATGHGTLSNPPVHARHGVRTDNAERVGIRTKSRMKNFGFAGENEGRVTRRPSIIYIMLLTGLRNAAGHILNWVATNPLSCWKARRRKMAHTELDLRERRMIETMLNAKIPVSKIAVEIGRHRSTVYREIRRNGFSDEELPYLDGYYGVNAQRCASARRARRRKLIRLPRLRDAVIDCLKEGWSPEQIAGRLLFEGHPIRVSHETIYAYVYSREAETLLSDKGWSSQIYGFSSSHVWM